MLCCFSHVSDGLRNSKCCPRFSSICCKSCKQSQCQFDWWVFQTNIHHLSCERERNSETNYCLRFSSHSLLPSCFPKTVEFPLFSGDPSWITGVCNSLPRGNPWFWLGLLLKLTYIFTGQSLIRKPTDGSFHHHSRYVYTLSVSGNVEWFPGLLTGSLQSEL